MGKGHVGRQPIKDYILVTEFRFIQAAGIVFVPFALYDSLLLESSY